MTDNIGVRSSAASDARQIAADDVGGVLYQIIKLAVGEDGAVTPVSSTSPLPVSLDAAGLAALETISISAPLSSPLGVRLSDGTSAIGSTAGRVHVDQDGQTWAVSGTVTPSQAGDVATALTDGRKTVTTPGTAVAIRASLECEWVVVTALKSNTEDVYVGGSGVLATAGSEVGQPLAAGESVTLPVANANLVFVDALVAGEGVTFTVGA